MYIYMYIHVCIYVYLYIFMHVHMYICIYIYLHIFISIYRWQTPLVVERTNQVCIFLPLYLSLLLPFPLSSSLSASICISISISISISVYDCVFPDRHVQVTHTPPPPLYTHLSIINIPRFHYSLSPPSSLVVLFSCCYVFAHVSLHFFHTNARHDLLMWFCPNQQI